MVLTQLVLTEKRGHKTSTRPVVRNTVRRLLSVFGMTLGRAELFLAVLGLFTSRIVSGVPVKSDGLGARAKKADDCDLGREYYSGSSFSTGGPGCVPCPRTLKGCRDEQPDDKEICEEVCTSES